MKIKVAYIIPTLTLGGAEKQQINMLNCIDRSRFEVRLYILKGDASLIHLINGNIEIKKYNINSPFDFSELKEFFSDILKYRPKIIHSHMYNANMVARTIKTLLPTAKIINHYHGLSNWLSGYRLLAEKSSKSLVDRFIVVSEESRNIRLSREGFPEDRTTLLLNSVNFEETTDICLKYKDIKNKDKIIIGMASRLIELKNIEAAIYLIKFLDSRAVDVELHIAGEGEHKERLKEYAKSLNIDEKVKFYGFVENMQRFYKRIDIFCISSTTEDTPLSVLEASMAGKPIIASKVGGLKSLFNKNSCVYLVEDFFNKLELERVKNFIKSINLFECCIRQNTLGRKEFSNRRYCQKLENIYQELLNEDGHN